MRSSATDEAEAQIKGRLCLRYVGTMLNKMLTVEALLFTICQLYSMIIIIGLTNDHQ